MKKIILAVVILIALSIGLYAWSKRMDKPALNDVVPAPEQLAVVSPDKGKKMPFSQYVAQGGPYECTIHQYLSDTNDKGTVFVVDGNMKGSFDTIAEGKKVMTSFIVKDGFSYTWNAATAIGVKMPIRIAERHEEELYAWSPDQVGEYDCKPLSGTGTNFVVPTNIKFTEVKAVPN